MIVAAFDIGGSSVKRGIYRVDDTGAHGLLAQDPLPLITHDFTELVAIVMATVDEYRNAYNLDAVGVSTAGIVADNTVIRCRKITGYENIQWDHIIIELPVVVTNDGQTSAWAEWSAHPSPLHLHAVVGTGLGGGIVAHGKIIDGASGQGGYLSHTKVSTHAGKIPCSCGQIGCAEPLVCARGILARYQQHQPAEDFRMVVNLAADGDPVARELFVDAGMWLGRTLASMITFLNPTQVTVGGGVLLADTMIPEHPYWTAMLASLQRSTFPRCLEAAIVDRASYGNESGMLGAALLAARKHPRPSL